MALAAEFCHIITNNQIRSQKMEEKIINCLIVEIAYAVSLLIAVAYDFNN